MKDSWWKKKEQMHDHEEEEEVSGIHSDSGNVLFTFLRIPVKVTLVKDNKELKTYLKPC